MKTSLLSDAGSAGSPVAVDDVGVLVGYKAADFTVAAQTYVRELDRWIFFLLVGAFTLVVLAVAVCRKKFFDAVDVSVLHNASDKLTTGTIASVSLSGKPFVRYCC